MSHTIHTTPAFPRTLRGPRGGRHIAPTPCAECVSFTSCRPGACSAPYGCESWVDEDGRRVDVLADLAFADIDPDPRHEGIYIPPVGGQPGRTIYGDFAPDAEDDEPDPDDPNPYQPSAATLQQMSGIFPTETEDPGPLFSGRKSN